MGNLFSYFWNETDVVEAAKGELCKVLETLPTSGLLKKTNTGFIYVDVDDRFIWSGIQVLKKFGFKEPPYFGEDLVGAHISVMFEAEGEEVDVQDILNMEVNFEVEKFEMVKPGGNRELFLVIVSADILDDLREENGLVKMRNPFHITIATRKEK